MTTAGSDLRLKLLAIPLICSAMMACTESPVQEYFCETFAQEGQALIYKQHIVQLNQDSTCLSGLVELPVCANHNQSTTTPWRSRDSKTQTREVVQVQHSKEQVILDIDQETRPAGTDPSQTETTHALMHYEFEKRSGALSVTTNESTDTTTFTCKPWTKRAWWQIY